MKKIVVVLVFLGMSCIWAEESINAQIEALQHLSPQERVAKMNRLKQQIANMNEEERLKVLEQLQSTQGSAQRSQFQMRQGIHTSPTNTMQQQYIQKNILPMKRQGR